MAAKDVGKKAAMGALIAGAVGYGIGVLTAPKSGKETRKDIKNAASKAKSEAEKKLKELHSELNTKLTDVRAATGKATGAARTEVDKAIEKATAAKEKVRDVLSSLHEGDAEDPDLQKALKDAKDALKNLEKFAKK